MIKYKTIVLQPFIVMLLFFSGAVYAEMELISPRSRMADDLANVLRSQFPSSKIDAFNGLVIVQADKSELAKIKQMVSLIDKPPKQFVIHVRGRESVQQNRQNLGMAGRYCKNNICISNDPQSNYPTPRSGQIQIGREVYGDRQHHDSYLNVDAIAQNTQRTQTTSQQIRAMEGGSAYLAFGNSIPVTTVSQGPFYQQVNTQMVDVLSGVYVKPFLLGNHQFRLQLNVSGDNVDAGRIQRKTTNTETQGALNTWVPLSGVDQNGDDSSKGLNGFGSGRHSQLDQYEVMVQLVE